MTEKKSFKVRLADLNELYNIIKVKEARRQELRAFWWEFNQLDDEISKLTNKKRRLHRALEMFESINNKELKVIAEKIVNAKENSEAGKDQDHLLYDEIETSFVTSSIKHNTLEYHISLYYTHLRHYDLKKIMSRIEELLDMKITAYYLLNPREKNKYVCELALHLIKNKSEDKDENV